MSTTGATTTRERGKGTTPPEVKKASFSGMQIPTVSYTIQNILISIGTVCASVASLALTCCVILPLACARAVLGGTRMGRLVGSGGVLESSGAETKSKRGKVVLIVGASRGIGLEVLKQYCPEPDTTVIAVSKSADSMRSAMIQLGDTPATLQMSTLDLSGSPKSISEAVHRLDEMYGPITHLYAISGISNHLSDGSPWNLDSTEAMIRVNVSGNVALVLSMYERMKARQYGKICIVGSVAGLAGPANMIAYASTKAFINTFATSLRVLATSANIDVVTVQPGFIDTRMTQKMRGQGSSMPDAEFAQAEGMARQMKLGVEKGGVGVVTWPTRQSVLSYSLRAVNPICEEIGKLLALKARLGGKKIT